MISYIFLLSKNNTIGYQKERFDLPKTCQHVLSNLKRFINNRKYTMHTELFTFSK